MHDVWLGTWGAWHVQTDSAIWHGGAAGQAVEGAKAYTLSGGLALLVWKGSGMVHSGTKGFLE